MGDCGRDAASLRSVLSRFRILRKVFCMFYGSYKNTLDTKGRLIVPKAFREQLGEQFMVTRGLDGCLFVFPVEEWNIFEEKLSKLPLTNKEARKVVRFFATGATLCEIDKQGRALIPEMLREFAGMTKEVVIDGSMKRIELWSREKYIEATAADDIDASMEALDGLDIDL